MMIGWQKYLSLQEYKSYLKSKNSDKIKAFLNCEHKQPSRSVLTKGRALHKSVMQGSPSALCSALLLRFSRFQTKSIEQFLMDDG